MTKTKAERETLLVQERAQKGTSKANALRREGFVPGVVYGKNKKPFAIQVAYKDLTRLMRATAGEHGLIQLSVESSGSAKPKGQPVLIKDVQLHPVDGQPVHVDFQLVSLTEKIRVPVELVLVGEPIGVKQDGGVLEHFLREIEVECLPTEIPSHINVDVSALQLGHSLHVSDVPAPEKSRIVTDPEGMVATVVAPRVEEKPAEEAAAEEAPAEPEVIKEKKEDADAEAKKGT